MHGLIFVSQANVRLWPILLQKSAVSDGWFGDFGKDDRL